MKERCVVDDDSLPNLYLSSLQLRHPILHMQKQDLQLGPNKFLRHVRVLVYLFARARTKVVGKVQVQAPV